MDGHLITRAVQLESHENFDFPTERQSELPENEDPSLDLEPCSNQVMTGTPHANSETKGGSQPNEKDAQAWDGEEAEAGGDADIETKVAAEEKGGKSAHASNDDTKISPKPMKDVEINDDEDEDDVNFSNRKAKIEKVETAIGDGKAEWSDAEREQAIIDEMQADINNLRRQMMGDLQPRWIQTPASLPALDIISKMLALVFSVHAISSTLKLARQAHEMAQISERIASLSCSNEWPMYQSSKTPNLIGKFNNSLRTGSQPQFIDRSTPKKLNGFNREGSEGWNDKFESRSSHSIDPDSHDESNGSLECGASAASQQTSAFHVSYAELSFLFRIEHLRDIRPNLIELEEWEPPLRRDEYATCKFSTLYRWRNGQVTLSSDKDYQYNLNPFLYRSATVFYCSAGEKYFLAVDSDARVLDVSLVPGNWEGLGFDLIKNKQGDTFSYLKVHPNQQRLPAPSSKSWMPHLLPAEYDFDPAAKQSTLLEANYLPAGLVGNLPLLLSLAAFSARANLLNKALCTSIQPRSWKSHNLPIGRKSSSQE